MTNEKTLLISWLKMILEYMIIFKNFQQVKEMILQVFVLRDYNYVKEHYKMVAIDLSKQKGLNSDPKAIQQINFTGNLENQTTIFFIFDEAKETVLDFSEGTVKELNYSNFIFALI